MKSTWLGAVGLYLLSSICAAQLPPGVTPEMIASSLPEEGAVKAEPGRYAVTSEAAFAGEGLKVFRPARLDRFPRQDTLPVVVWGNGGCAIDNARYAGFLETIASHGFLVVTTTAAPAAVTPGAAAARRQATAGDLTSAIDWALHENERAGSPLLGKVDTKHIAVMGQSCGGRLSLELGTDPRVGTIGVFNMGLQPGQFNQLAKLHGPVLLINGHERDFMFGPSKATFEALETLPVFYGSRHGAGHTGTSYHPGGGEFANVAANWVRWQFKQDRKASQMFVGDHCGLCTNKNWDVAAKRLAFTSAATAVALPLPPCDRECLRGALGQVLYAFVDHDVSKLPVAANLRVTEDGVEKALDKVGLVRSVTRLRGYRQDVIDERTGQVLAGVLVEESGAPVILVVRVKVEGDRLRELELISTRSRTDGMIFAIDHFTVARKAMSVVPRPAQLATRAEALEIALHYPRGLNSAKTFNAVDTPFAPEARRIENGALMAGPGCTFNKGCEDIGNQPLTIFERLGKVTLRDAVVDERTGIVALRLSWNQSGPGSDKLTAWELFKVWDRQIHAVEAYIRLFKPEQELGGWPLRVAQP